jgi:hypothetical protein
MGRTELRHPIYETWLFGRWRRRFHSGSGDCRDFWVTSVGLQVPRRDRGWASGGNEPLQATSSGTIVC